MKKFRINNLLLESISDIVHEAISAQLSEAAETITREEAVTKLLSAGNSIFTVEFTKLDGTHRIMNARLGVKKHLKGGELRYDAAAKGYVPVYDLQKAGYRILNKNTIVALRLDNKNYVISNDND